MEDLSEQAIRANCPHCDLHSSAYSYILEQTDKFTILCDSNPLTEGHILIIPKQHITCIAEYPEDLFKEFLDLDKKVSQFVYTTYKAVSSFEHGIFGQTVFHSHIHYLPYSGDPMSIVPEGPNKLKQITEFRELKEAFEREKGYLYFSINNTKWIVDAGLAKPRFFRDRFSSSLGRPERGNWKTMRANTELFNASQEDCRKTQRKWDNWIKASSI